MRGCGAASLLWGQREQPNLREPASLRQVRHSKKEGPALVPSHRVRLRSHVLVGQDPRSGTGSVGAGVWGLGQEGWVGVLMEECRRGCPWHRYPSLVSTAAVDAGASGDPT